MSTIKANTLLHSDGSTTNPPAIPALDQRMAKAWVHFNGQGTVAIVGSYGVSSLTDNAVGEISINLTTALANTTPVISGTASGNVIISRTRTYTHTTTSVGIRIMLPNTLAKYDDDQTSVVVHNT